MEISEIVWFGIGALTVLVLLGAATAIDRRRGARSPKVLPEPREPRREHHRVTVHLPADVIIEGKAGPLEGTIMDLSLGGASILVDDPLPVGIHLVLRFEPGIDAERNLAAEVVRCEPSHWGRRHYIHSRFRELSTLQTRHLEHVLADLERAELRP